jgi:copper(I)-binding protein
MPDRQMTCRLQQAAPKALVFALTLACFGGVAPAHSHGAEIGAISIGHFWTPESEKPVPVTPVFGPILNGGEQAVTLRGVSSPAAKRGGICKQENGQIEWLGDEQILPSKALILADWREHICLEGLDRALRHGETFPVNLDFGSAGKVTIDVYVGVEGD